MSIPEAAVAIVHAPGAEESVLLIRRAEREEDPWSGHWSFPGGRRDPGDLDLLDTAVRELEEECGIQLDRGRMEAALPPTNAGRRLGRVVLVAPFVFRVDGVLPVVPDPAEVADAEWVPLETLRDPSRHRLTPVPRLPEAMAFPAIELNGTPLWGFTYRVLTEWLQLHAPVPEGAAATVVLEFLQSQGLTVRQEWTEPRPGDPAARKIAVVSGEIPVQAVMEHFASPLEHFPRVNLLEVHPDHIRIVGLALEEYLIRAS